MHGLLNEKDNALFSVAIENGNIDDGTFNKLLKILSPVGTALTDIDIPKLIQKPQYTNNYFIRAINSLGYNR